MKKDPVASSASASSRNGSVRRGVIGVLFRGPEMLMIRRAENVPKGGCWCFPGGHVEPGENARRAVIRELAEELGIHVQPRERIGAVRVLDSNHLLVVWKVAHLHGELRIAPKEIAEFRWVTPLDARAISPGLPSNDRVLCMLGV